jgi:YfiH family protein
LNAAIARDAAETVMSHCEFAYFSSLLDIPGLAHAVTVRDGGVSDGAYSSLNLGYHVGDDAAKVTENRQHLAAALGYDGSTLVAAQQVHGAGVHIVGREEQGRGALDWQSALPATDALIVAQPQTPVLILVADCAPLLFVDAHHRVLAVVHAGWRGAVAGVASAALAQMQGHFLSDASAVRVGIGPCLCVDCLEIGPEVAAGVALVEPQAIVPRNPRPHLDLRAVLQSDLQRAGVLAQHIETSPDCPRCRTERFFSHRGQGGIAGRFGLVAWWK